MRGGWVLLSGWEMTEGDNIFFRAFLLGQIL